MNRQELIALCLTYPDAYEDYPFDDINWTVIRHRVNRKIFAWIYERDGSLNINLKCDPMKADFLRSVYKGILPGYHMNKQHWNTVVIGSDVPPQELDELIRESHALTQSRPKQIAGKQGGKR